MKTNDDTSSHFMMLGLVAGLATCAFSCIAADFNPQPDPPGKPAIGENNLHNPPSDKTGKSPERPATKLSVIGPNDKGAVIAPNVKGGIIDPNVKGN